MNALNRKELITKVKQALSELDALEMYQVAVTIYNELKDVDWSETKKVHGFGKMVFMEDISKIPGFPVKDADCIRQVLSSGEFAQEYFNGDLSYLSKMRYWDFHNIARAKLSEDKDESEGKKVDVVRRVIDGDLPAEKIKEEINLIKRKEKEFLEKVLEKLQEKNAKKYKKVIKKRKPLSAKALKEKNAILERYTIGGYRANSAIDRAFSIDGCVIEQPEKIVSLYIKAVELEQASGDSYEVDHIIPLSKGGKHSPDNLWILTKEDNGMKCKGAKMIKDCNLSDVNRWITENKSYGIDVSNEVDRLMNLK